MAKQMCGSGAVGGSRNLRFRPFCFLAPQAHRTLESLRSCPTDGSKDKFASAPTRTAHHSNMWPRSGPTLRCTSIIAIAVKDVLANGARLLAVREIQLTGMSVAARWPPLVRATWQFCGAWCLHPCYTMQPRMKPSRCQCPKSHFVRALESLFQDCGQPCDLGLRYGAALEENLLWHGDPKDRIVCLSLVAYCNTGIFDTASI